MPFLIGSAVAALLAGWLAYGLAARKRRSAWAWAVASAILIVPLFVLAVLPSNRPGDTTDSMSGDPKP
jgi:hypothetical protein